MPDANMATVAKFFEIPLAQFRKEWGALSDSDKAQLKAGLGDETLTY